MKGGVDEVLIDWDGMGVNRRMEGTVRAFVVFVNDKIQ